MTETEETLNLPKPFENVPISPTFRSKIDAAVQNIVRANPELTKAEIAKQAVAMGACKTEQSVWNRFYHNDFLRRDIEEVKTYHHEFGQRLILPKSLKELKKMQSEKGCNGDKKLQLSAINTALKYFKGEPAPGSEQGVNIGSIQNAQIIIESNAIRDNEGDN